MTREEATKLYPRQVRESDRYLPASYGQPAPLRQAEVDERIARFDAAGWPLAVLRALDAGAPLRVALA